MSPSSTVHDGQHDTKYVTFKLLMHAAFVADEIWEFKPEPARTTSWGKSLNNFCEKLCEKRVQTFFCENFHTNFWVKAQNNFSHSG